MQTNLSDDTKDLVRDMIKSEAWKVFEEYTTKESKDLRALATQRTIALEDRLWYSAEAEAREKLISGFKDTIK